MNYGNSFDLLIKVPCGEFGSVLCLCLACDVVHISTHGVTLFHGFKGGGNVPINAAVPQQSKEKGNMDINNIVFIQYCTVLVLNAQCQHSFCLFMRDHHRAH